MQREDEVNCIYLDSYLSIHSRWLVLLKGFVNALCFFIDRFPDYSFYVVLLIVFLTEMLAGLSVRLSFIDECNVLCLRCNPSG